MPAPHPLQRSSSSAALRHCIAFATLLGAPLLHAQLAVLADEFNAPSVDADHWTHGATSTAGTASANGATVTLATNQTVTARSALLAHGPEFDPFAGKLAIQIDGLALGGVAGNNAISLYAVVGRLPADTGGAATAALAATYTTGGGSYYTQGGTGGALGLSVLRYSNHAVYLQVLDSGGINGTGSYANALGSNRLLSGVPSSILWTIDGRASSFTVTLTGATFSATGTSTLTASFSRFASAQLVAGRTRIARLALGAFNTGDSIVSGATATFDRVAVSSSALPGEPFMMGINLSAAGFGAHDPAHVPGIYNQSYTYPTTAHLDYYKARGVELIRFPFIWERIQRTLYGPLDAAELARLDTLLDQIEERGLRVVLDLHNYGRYRLSGIERVIGSAEVPRSAYQDVWEKLAVHVKNRDSLWAYGIMNEPYDMGAHTWKDSAQVAVNGIRKHDTRHAILLPGDGYSGAHRWLTHGANLIGITDPAQNLIFEAHQYFDSTSAGAYDASYDVEGATPTIGITRLAPFVDWCRTNGVRGFVGEYGVPDNDPRWITLLDNTLGYLAANRISGTYWAGGPWWGDYALSTEPKRAHDEAPQMASLIKRGAGPGTRFWPAFSWYNDATTVGPQGSYTYHYKSTTAALEVNFDDANAAYGNYSTARGIQFSYTVPSGGWAGAGMQINGGTALAPNFDRNHVLTFYLKGSAGSSVHVFFQDTADVLSAKVNTAAYVTTSGSWQQVRIPLSAFIAGSFTGTQRIKRLAFEGLPADGAARNIQLDRFVIEKPESVAPSVTITAPTGSNFVVNTPIQVTVSASDPNGGIDLVEFLLNGHRVAVDRTAPYTATVMLPAPGTYRLAAIAYDLHGNPKRSTIKTLTAP